MRYYRTKPLALLLVAMLVASSELFAVYDPLGNLEQAMQGGTTLQSQIRQGLNGRKSGRLLKSGDWTRLTKFYAERDYKPRWIKGGRPLPVVADLLARIKATPFTGISKELLLPFAGFEPTQTVKKRLAGYELLFSELLLRYAKVSAVGRYSPKRYDDGWRIKSRSFNAGRFLQRLSAAEKSPAELLDALAPGHIAYRRLLRVYHYYLAIAERGGWAALPVEMTTLKPGAVSRWAPFLRLRLRSEFNYAGLEPEDSKRYGPELVEAVKVFQQRNGLETDGVVGPKTRAVLDIPVEERLRSILASLERWRWMPRNLDGRYLLVNIPAFELGLFEGDRQIWGTKVIIGRKKRPTPSIKSTISQLKVNPKWHVPDKIAVKDLIPKQLRNPRFLSRSGYQVFLRGSNEEIYAGDIDWEYYQYADDFPYLIRQNAGKRNALGQLKFEMPSKYAIYLHDTPTKRLFGRDKRAFSSGCVRVQSPYELAGMLLDKSEPENGRWKVMKEIETGETKYIRLPSKVPVYLTYFTTWVDEQGQAHFRQDIYGRNKKFTDIPVLNH